MKAALQSPGVAVVEAVVNAEEKPALTRWLSWFYARDAVLL
jgi:hypothetical protein